MSVIIYKSRQSCVDSSNFHELYFYSRYILLVDTTCFKFYYRSVILFFMYLFRKFLFRSKVRIFWNEIFRGNVSSNYLKAAAVGRRSNNYKSF